MEQLISILTSYITGLDWTYILTFILLSYFVNHDLVRNKIHRATAVKTQTRYRIALTGILYGVAIYFIRGYKIRQVEMLISSFIFALVFHKLILEGILNRFIPGQAGDALASPGNAPKQDES